MKMKNEAPSRLAAHLGARRLRAEQALERAILKQLETYQVAAESLADLNRSEQLQMALGTLYLERPTDLLDFLRRRTKLEVWSAFAELRDAHGLHLYAGLIFNSHGHGLWVLHNYERAYPAAAIVCNDDTTDEVLTCESFTGFCRRLLPKLVTDSQ